MKESKKASAKIITLIQAINPKVSKNTSYNEAWEIISEYAGFEGDIKNSNKNSTTTFTLYKGEKIIKEFVWENAFKPLEGDWDWTLIFSEVIEYMMKNKLVKKPRKSKK